MGLNACGAARVGRARVVYVEGHAALVAAVRLGRLQVVWLGTALGEFVDHY